MPNTGDNARRLLLQRERAAQLRVVAEFRKIQKRIEMDLFELLKRIDKERRLTGNASPSSLIQQARARDLLAQVTDEINRISRTLGLETTNAQVRAVDIAQAQAADETRITTNLNFFDSAATQELIGIAGDGQPLFEHFADVAPSVRSLMFDALFTGIATGQSNQQIARAVNQAVGFGAARSMTIVRTETNRAYREATRKFYDDAPEIVGWRWVAALDLTTCPICWALHGSIFLTKQKMATHPNCRCTMVPHFRGDPKPETGPEKFARLTIEQQKTILGPGRLDLYNQGANLGDFVETYNSKFGPGRRIVALDRVAFNPSPRTPAVSASGPGSLFPDSVVRNPDGSLRLMFHGSNSRIDQFDLAKVRQSDLDAPFNGFWFTDNKANASPALRDPDFLHEVYLDIRNPITRAEIEALRRADPLVRKLSHADLRLHLQAKGFDGVRWEFRPHISAAQFARTGDVTFTTAGGTVRRLVKDPQGGVNLLDADGQFITGYTDLDDYLKTEFDQEIWVAFRPDQIKIKRVVDLRGPATPPAALPSSATPTPALPKPAFNPGDPVPTFKDAAEATEYFERRYPNQLFDFTGIDHSDGFLQAQADELARLFDLYPEAAARLKYVGTYADKNKIAPITQNLRFGAGSYAHFQPDFNQHIALNRKYFGDAKSFRELKERNLRVGWSTTDADAGTLSHEFGHAVDDWLKKSTPGGTKDAIGDFELTEITSPGNNVASMRDRIVKELKPTPKEQSDYSLSGRGKIQAAEQFAEGFAMIQHRPRSEWSRFARALDALLDIIKTDARPKASGSVFSLDGEENIKALRKINELYKKLGLPEPVPGI